ncbi:MAG: sensor histidine kinase [Lachnospiraceae bacterium]
MIRRQLTRWTNWMDNNKLRTIIMVPFTLIGVCAIMILAFGLYIRFTNTAKEMVTEKNIQIMEQTNQAMNNYLKEMMQVSDSVYYHILKQEDVSNADVGESVELLYNANQDKVVNIALFDMKGEVVYGVPSSTAKKNSSPRKEKWYLDAASNIENLHFSLPYVQNIFDTPDASYRWVVSLSRYVELEHEGKVEDGILLVDMNFSGIEQILKNVNLGSSAYLYLMDQNGEIIYHPRQQLLYSGLAEEDNRHVKDYEDGGYVIEFQGRQRLNTVKTVGYTGWKLVAVVPMEEVVSSYQDLRYYILILSVCLIIVLIWVSTVVSEKLTIPIERLEDSVESLEAGNLETEIAISGSEEIRHLGKSVQSMVNQMKRLMEEIVMEQEMKRRTEFEALETQINPHFLYNTLDSIVWMIENGKNEGAVKMVTSLARLFRISIRGRSIVPVRDELAHAEYYLAIQNIRYKNKFAYSVEVKEDVKDYATVKLILQPMIENSINHGMAHMEKDDGGEIIVRAYTDGDNLIMEVEDNGCGMTQERISQILNGGEYVRSKAGGIGVGNVNERIRLHFGREYGVEIISEPDEGTIMRMRMPLQKTEKKEGGRRI